ncbi:MAG: hypothetical protein OXB99_17800 [Acidimicrobiaceae bacterium]|nr:hypothetical protein [Acidimicrobiaceae bacterium]
MARRRRGYGLDGWFRTQSQKQSFGFRAARRPSVHEILQPIQIEWLKFDNGIEESVSRWLEMCGGSRNDPPDRKLPQVIAQLAEELVAAVLVQIVHEQQMTRGFRIRSQCRLEVPQGIRYHLVLSRRELSQRIGKGISSFARQRTRVSDHTLELLKTLVKRVRALETDVLGRGSVSLDLAQERCSSATRWPMDVHIQAQVERSTDPLKFRITIGEEFAVGI